MEPALALEIVQQLQKEIDRSLFPIWGTGKGEVCQDKEDHEIKGLI